MHIETPADLLRAYGAGTKKRFYADGDVFLNREQVLEPIFNHRVPQCGARTVEKLKVDAQAFSLRNDRSGKNMLHAQSFRDRGNLETFECG